MTTGIEYQNNSIQKQITQTNTDATTYLAKAKYQTNMYQAVKYANQALLVLYVFFFIFIHGIILHKYLSGVKRSELHDTIWLTILFFYPYVIYPIEKAIYFCATYILALIYGQTYVYQFDRWLMLTDFYKNPDQNAEAGHPSFQQSTEQISANDENILDTDITKLNADLETNISSVQGRSPGIGSQLLADATSLQTSFSSGTGSELISVLNQAPS